MTQHITSPAAPNLKFSHMGIVVEDIDVMTRFYTEVLGFSITDKGEFGEMRVVFMSRDPVDHHQIVLTSGRPKDLPRNTLNPEFGPSIQQISFKMGSLADLRDMKERLKEGGASRITAASHGNSWSLYAHDPEENYIEFFVDTDWYAFQPFYEPLDLDQADETIRAETEARCLASPGFRPMQTWTEDMRKIMAPPFKAG